MDDSEEENEQDEAQLRIERDRSELLRQELEVTKRERDVAQREAVLARRELELANTANPGSINLTDHSRGHEQDAHPVPPQLRADVKSIGELLGDFDGTNRYFENWDKQVRLVKRLFAVDDAIMKIIISSKLKEKADRWFRSKSKYTEMTLDALLSAMKDGFDQKPSKVYRLKKFELRTWQTNESFNDYYHEKFILGNLVPIEEDDLLDYLMDGIPDQMLRNQARMQNFNSVKDLLNGFRKISLSNRTKKDSHHGEKATTDKPAEKIKPEVKPPKTGMKEKTGEKSIKCYNCNKLGYISKDCPKENEDLVIIVATWDM